MAIEHIHTYLVHPNKNVEVPIAIGGAIVPLEGMVYDLLKDVYDKAEQECVIDISFNQGVEGEQNNVCRSLLQGYLNGPSVASGKFLADRLGNVTTKRSGLGLLFLVSGQEGASRKAVLARFPAKSGILAEQDQQELSVEYLERVFMRSATAYKAVYFAGRSVADEFWIGSAVDRQINSRDVESSAYWIGDFLDADLRTTSALGTRRLAIAIRDAARTIADLPAKQELVAAATLANGLANVTLSPREFADRFGLSEQARSAVFASIPGQLQDEAFRFDRTEFSRQVPVRSVQLNTGALLMAQANNFDEVFEKADIGGNRVRYSTVGTIVSEKLEKPR